jgi:acetylornithine/succinyldiaminopimelate/putrescine aminotransferase
LNPNRDSSFNGPNGHLMGNIDRLNMMVDHAFGSTLYLEDGHKVLDFWGDEGVQSLGYNTPELMSAIERFGFGGSLQPGRMSPHQLPDIYPNRLRLKAAQMLCERHEMDKVFFSNSGTEANEAMIKLARKYWWDREGGRLDGYLERNPGAACPDRHRIYTIEGNFHGRTGYSMAASDPRPSPYHRWGFGPGAHGFGVLDENLNVVMEDGREADPHEPDWDVVAGVMMAPILGNNQIKVYSTGTSGCAWMLLVPSTASSCCLTRSRCPTAGSGSTLPGSTTPSG